MENLEFISKLLDGKVVFGAREEITPNLSLIPVYKVKISFLNLSTDIKSTVGDGSSGSINVTPLCFVQIKDNNVSIMGINENASKKEDILDAIPSMISNIDLTSILKNFKPL